MPLLGQYTSDLGFGGGNKPFRVWTKALSFPLVAFLSIFSGAQEGFWLSRAASSRAGVYPPLSSDNGRRLWASPSRATWSPADSFISIRSPRLPLTDNGIRSFSVSLIRGNTDENGPLSAPGGDAQEQTRSQRSNVSPSFRDQPATTSGALVGPQPEAEGWPAFSTSLTPPP